MIRYKNSLAKIIRHAINLCNFGLRKQNGHRSSVLMYYAFNTFIAMSPIFNMLIPYPCFELTLIKSLHGNDELVYATQLTMCGSKMTGVYMHPCPHTILQMFHVSRLLPLIISLTACVLRLAIMLYARHTYVVVSIEVNRERMNEATLPEVFSRNHPVLYPVLAATPRSTSSYHHLPAKALLWFLFHHLPTQTNKAS